MTLLVHYTKFANASVFLHILCSNVEATSIFNLSFYGVIFIRVSINLKSIYRSKIEEIFIKIDEEKKATTNI